MSHNITPVLGEATLQELREAICGQTLTPVDRGYHDAARIWNGAHDGHNPAVIVRCADAADVISCVGFARSTGLPLAVRGGGHSLAGLSTCDGVNAVTGWHHRAEGPAHQDWARAVISAAQTASTGRAYVNFLGDPDPAVTSYGDET
jgi:FAD/FMN-containing dehydrogenase